MVCEVVYLSAGKSHCDRLAVSLFSLRWHYGGAVRVLDMGGSDGLTERIAKAAGAKCERVAIRPVASGKNAIYAAKASIGSFLGKGCYLFLDCDTTVHAGIDELFGLCSENHGLLVTRFSNWVTTGQIMAGRLRKWSRVSSPVLEVRKAVSRLIEEPHVAINTGVFCVRGGVPFLQDWPALVALNPTFICDEIAAQLLITKHKHGILGDRWNHSAKFGIDHNPVIRHYHGGSHVGHAVWRAVADAAQSADFAGMKGW